MDHDSYMVEDSRVGNGQQALSTTTPDLDGLGNGGDSQESSSVTENGRDSDAESQESEDPSPEGFSALVRSSEVSGSEGPGGPEEVTSQARRLASQRPPSAEREESEYVEDDEGAEPRRVGFDPRRVGSSAEASAGPSRGGGSSGVSQVSTKGSSQREDSGSTHRVAGGLPREGTNDQVPARGAVGADRVDLHDGSLTKPSRRASETNVVEARGPEIHHNLSGGSEGRPEDGLSEEWLETRRLEWLAGRWPGLPPNEGDNLEIFLPGVSRDGQERVRRGRRRQKGSVLNMGHDLDVDSSRLERVRKVEVRREVQQQGSVPTTGVPRQVKGRERKQKGSVLKMGHDLDADSSRFSSTEEVPRVVARQEVQQQGLVLNMGHDLDADSPGVAPTTEVPGQGRRVVTGKGERMDEASLAQPRSPRFVNRYVGQGVVDGQTEVGSSQFFLAQRQGSRSESGRVRRGRQGPYPRVAGVVRARRGVGALRPRRWKGAVRPGILWTGMPAR
jgi:hypothetical protein